MTDTCHCRTCPFLFAWPIIVAHACQDYYTNSNHVYKNRITMMALHMRNHGIGEWDKGSSGEKESCCVVVVVVCVCVLKQWIEP